jgi:hypothetical protein
VQPRSRKRRRPPDVAGGGVEGPNVVPLEGHERGEDTSGSESCSPRPSASCSSGSARTRRMRTSATSTARTRSWRGTSSAPTARTPCGTSRPRSAASPSTGSRPTWRSRRARRSASRSASPD